MPASPILGQIMPFAGNFAPNGWALCNGQILAITSNVALFSLIGTTYGGNGISTFALPNLQGRAIIGAVSNGFYVPGTVSGETQVNLTAAELPSHNHLIQAATGDGVGRLPVQPAGKIFANNTIPSTGAKKIFGPTGTAEVTLSPVGTNVGYDGGGAPHNNMQPYLAITYVIALQGVFPSRS